MVEGGTVVFITSNAIGHGDLSLGRTLLSMFLSNLTQSSEKPATIIFINNGVKLVVDQSAVIDKHEEYPLDEKGVEEYIEIAELKFLQTLVKLSEAGVEILACSTCLEYYKIKGLVAVGKPTTMPEVVDRLAKAGKVITI